MACTYTGAITHIPIDDCEGAIEHFSCCQDDNTPPPNSDGSNRRRIIFLGRPMIPVLGGTVGFGGGGKSIVANPGPPRPNAMAATPGNVSSLTEK